MTTTRTVFPCCRSCSAHVYARPFFVRNFCGKRAWSTRTGGLRTSATTSGSTFEVLNPEECSLTNSTATAQRANNAWALASRAANAVIGASDEVAERPVATAREALLKPRGWAAQPIPRAVPSESVKAHVGSYSSRGIRRANEDRWSVAQVTHSMWCMGVFDGHGGTHAAEYAADHMHEFLHDALRSGADGQDLSEILRNAMAVAAAKLDADAASINRDTNQFITSGTTALVLVVEGHRVALANVGDSRALLVQWDGAKFMNAPHLPGIPAERERILECGGEVFDEPTGVSRINGQLGLSRSLGDVRFRQYGVVPLPDVVIYDVTERDHCIVMATDGLWDVMSPAGAQEIVEGCASPMEAARRLVESAELAGVEDNCTVIVVRMPGWEAGTGQPLPTDPNIRCSRNLGSVRNMY